MLQRLSSRMSTLAGVGLAALLVASAAMAQSGGMSKPEKANLTVGMIPISNLTPLYVAQKLGYFQENGVTVETTISSAGAAMTGALIGGSLDFVYVNYVSVFQAVTQGFGIVVVAHQNSAQESPPDAAPLVVRSDGSIATIADLRGKKVAINALKNINSLATQHFLDTNGLPSDSVNFVEVPFPNMGDALTKGQVDAAVMVEPFVTFMTKAGKIKPLGYPFIGMTPGLPIAGFVSSTKFVKENPATVKAFVSALARANDYLNGNPEELIKYTAEFTKSKPELIRDLTLDRWSHAINVDRLQILADLSHKYGLQNKPVKVTDLLHETATK